MALSFITLASGDDSFLLELTEANFDVLLRETPVALVAYVNQNTALHYPSLMPTLRELANAYEHAGIGVGTISDQYRELIERFGIDAFPTLHWMDGSKKWPYYASEATPVRHEGPRSFEALAGFIEAKTGIPPRVAEPGSQQEPQAAEPEAPSIGREDVLTAVDEHDCRNGGRHSAVGSGWNWTDGKRPTSGVVHAPTPMTRPGVAWPHATPVCYGGWTCMRLMSCSSAVAVSNLAMRSASCIFAGAANMHRIH